MKPCFSLYYKRVGKKKLKAQGLTTSTSFTTWPLVPIPHNMTTRPVIEKNEAAGKTSPIQQNRLTHLPSLSLRKNMYLSWVVSVPSLDSKLKAFLIYHQWLIISKGFPISENNPSILSSNCQYYQKQRMKSLSRGPEESLQMYKGPRVSLILY